MSNKKEVVNFTEMASMAADAARMTYKYGSESEEHDNFIKITKNFTRHIKKIWWSDGQNNTNFFDKNLINAGFSKSQISALKKDFKSNQSKTESIVKNALLNNVKNPIQHIKLSNDTDVKDNTDNEFYDLVHLITTELSRSIAAEEFAIIDAYLRLSFSSDMASDRDECKNLKKLLNSYKKNNSSENLLSDLTEEVKKMACASANKFAFTFTDLKFDSQPILDSSAVPFIKNFHNDLYSPNQVSTVGRGRGDYVMADMRDKNNICLEVGCVTTALHSQKEQSFRYAQALSNSLKAKVSRFSNSNVNDFRVSTLFLINKKTDFDSLINQNELKTLMDLHVLAELSSCMRSVSEDNYNDIREKLSYKMIREVSKGVVSEEVVIIPEEFSNQISINLKCLNKSLDIINDKLLSATDVKIKTELKLTLESMIICNNGTMSAIEKTSSKNKQNLIKEFEKINKEIRKTMYAATRIGIRCQAVDKFDEDFKDLTEENNKLEAKKYNCIKSLLEDNSFIESAEEKLKVDSKYKIKIVKNDQSNKEYLSVLLSNFNSGISVDVETFLSKVKPVISEAGNDLSITHKSKIEQMSKILEVMVTAEKTLKQDFEYNNNDVVAKAMIDEIHGNYQLLSNNKNLLYNIFKSKHLTKNKILLKKIKDVFSENNGKNIKTKIR